MSTSMTQSQLTPAQLKAPTEILHD